MWSPAGALLGGLLGVRGAISGGWGPGMVALCAGVGWLCSLVLPHLVLGSGAQFIKSIYNPSGSSSPSKKQYSQAESLVARGLFRDAVSAFEVAAAENPQDPQPYLRVARIYRDDLGEFENAARWFRKARRESAMEEGVENLVVREVVELFVHKMNEPAKAAPELARFAEMRGGTPEGDWAEQQLREVKEAMLGNGES